MNERRIDFAHYPSYEELTAAMESLGSEYPDLAKLLSIGRSSEGRELWLMEITNSKTGPAEKKPAMFLDGNTHAGEVTGSVVCLRSIWYLLTNYGTDLLVTTLLDERTFYILPRLSPDGAEVYLKTPYILRSVSRLCPYEEEQDGLYPEDVNKDGWITQMRVRDPNGDWKISDKDPRLMVKRAPGEVGGIYYRVYVEGLIRNYDGGELRMVAPKYGLDFNRNWPGHWSPLERGSGLYPLSEPEVRAVADFIATHPNICVRISYHTSGGTLNRPPCFKPDTFFPLRDMRAYDFLGKLGKEVTGYPLNPPINPPREKEGGLHGTADDWDYEFMGLLHITFECWDAEKVAGVGGHEERVELAKAGLPAEKVEERDLALLKWNDKELNGEGFLDWTPFNHPQIGLVEIGGWKTKYVTQNPPQKFLEAEAHKDMVFALKVADLLPLLRVVDAKATPIGNSLFKISAVVQNEGFFPTNVTEQAIHMKRVRPVVARIHLPPGAELVVGKENVELGHLDGLFCSLTPSLGYTSGNEPRVPYIFWGPGPRRRAAVEWVIKIKSKEIKSLQVSAISDRAGNPIREVVIP